MSNANASTEQNTGAASAVLATLRDDQSRWLGRLAELAVDELLARPLPELVSRDELMEALDAALAPELTTAVIGRYLRPAAARERQRGAESGERVGAIVPAALTPKILDVARAPFPLNPDIIEDFVDQGAVRTMLGAVVREAIVGFVGRSKMAGLGGAASLVGSIGKGLLGGMGRGIEQQLERAVSDFIDQSMARLTRKVVELAVSERGQALQGEMRADLAARALKSRLSLYYEELAKLPDEQIWALVPPILAHNVAREPLRGAIEKEIDLALTAEAGRPAQELLQELGALERSRALAVEALTRALAQVVGGEAFGRWLEELLDSSGS